MDTLTEFMSTLHMLVISPCPSLIALSSSCTCLPAFTAGYLALLSSVLNLPIGSSTLSEAMWLNSVDDTRHNDLPADLAASTRQRKGVVASHLAASMASTVLSVTTTSWKPASTCPPVRYSNCLPACSSRQSCGTLTGIFLPERVHTNRPGKRERPWMVIKFRSAIQSANHKQTTADRSGS